jgi:hypothetical protein
MSPKGRRTWKPARDRREIVIAVASVLVVVLITASLVWFLRPNKTSGPSGNTPISLNNASTTTVAGTATTVPATTAPATTAPVASTP